MLPKNLTSFLILFLSFVESFKKLGWVEGVKEEVFFQVQWYDGDRYIVLSTKGTSALQLSRAKPVSFCHRKIESLKTVARRLHKEGLYPCRPVLCVALSTVHRRTRQECSRQGLYMGPNVEYVTYFCLIVNKN